MQTVNLQSRERSEQVGALILKPAIYSSSQTIPQIIEKISKYPEQKTAVLEASKGLVIEFINAQGRDFGQPVGTLSEYYETEKVNHFFIKTRGYGVMIVERLRNGKFVVIEAFDEEKNLILQEL